MSGSADWKVGDWVIFDLSVGQIKELGGEGMASFSDGSFETSGRLNHRFRPLTLRNKNIVETFDIYYGRLRQIDGESGFNYPDIHQYFSNLALDAIDGDDQEEQYKLAQDFIRHAREYRPLIHDVRLFRPTRRAAEQGA